MTRDFDPSLQSAAPEDFSVLLDQGSNDSWDMRTTSGGESLLDLFQRAKAQRDYGLLEKSYSAFERALVRDENNPRLSLSRYIHLSENALFLAQASIGGSNKKEEWFNKSHDWSEKALNLDPESFITPGLLLHTVVVAVRARYEHMSFEQDPDAQKDHLVKAQSHLDSIRELAESDNENLAFSFNLSQHLVADSMVKRVSSVEDKREWNRILIDSSDRVLSLSKDNKVTSKYSRSAALAILFLGDTEEDVDQKRRFYFKAFDYVQRNLSLPEDSHNRLQLIGILSAGMSVADRMAELALTDEEEIYWLENDLKYEEDAAALEIDDKRILNRLNFAIKKCNKLISLDTEMAEFWKGKIHGLYRRQADLNKQVGDMNYASKSYNAAANIAEELSYSSSESLKWVKACYEDYLDWSEINYAKGDLRSAAYQLGITSKLAIRAHDIDPSARREWDKRIYITNSTSGDIFYSLEDMYGANIAYDRALKSLYRLRNEATSEADIEVWNKKIGEVMAKIVEVGDKQRVLQQKPKTQ